MPLHTAIDVQPRRSAQTCASALHLSRQCLILLLLCSIINFSACGGSSATTQTQKSFVPPHVPDLPAPPTYRQPVIDNGGETPYRPRLLFGPDDIAALKAKLGSSSFTSTTDVTGATGDALTATLNSERSDTAITYAQEHVNDATQGENNYGQVVGQVATAYDNYLILLIYDLQSKYMTDDERNEIRNKLLISARNWYTDSTQSNIWYYEQRQTNNWLYHYFGHKIQNLLYSGIIFRDDPDADKWRARGAESLYWTVQNWPSDGKWDLDSETWIKEPTEVDVVDESAGSPNDYGIRSSYYLAELMYIAERNLDWRAHPIIIKYSKRTLIS